MRLVSIDPGLGGTGIAVWENARLTDVLIVRTDPGDPLVERVMIVRAAAARMVKPLDLLVIEYQQTYGGRAAKGDANDLLKATLLSGALLTLSDCIATLVLPHEWKGSAKKDVTRARCLEDLTEAELQIVSERCGKNQKLQGDVWDAVGIGLWWLRRAGLRQASALATSSR